MHFDLWTNKVLDHFSKINIRKCYQNKDISKYRAKATENMQEVKWKNKIRLKEWLSIFLKDGETGNTKDKRIRRNAWLNGKALKQRIRESKILFLIYKYPPIFTLLLWSNWRY